MWAARTLLKNNQGDSMKETAYEVGSEQSQRSQRGMRRQMSG